MLMVQWAREKTIETSETAFWCMRRQRADLHDLSAVIGELAGLISKDSQAAMR